MQHSPAVKKPLVLFTHEISEKSAGGNDTGRSVALAAAATAKY